jgi:hypothetical protein
MDGARVISVSRHASPFTLILFTDDPALAARADAAGIDWIGPDIEILGKRARQGHLGLRISAHEPESVSAVRAALRRAACFARTNPIHDGSQEEIDDLLARGAQVLMLPMFTTVEEVARFIGIVAGRARTCLLLETAAAATRARQIFAVPGIDHVHVGLNDLALTLGIENRFELAASGLLDMLAGVAREAGLSFGFGGLARAHQPGLPVPGDLLYAQYARLGASSAIVTRVFMGASPERLNLVEEVAACRRRIQAWQAEPPAVLEQARQDLSRCLWPSA